MEKVFKPVTVGKATALVSITAFLSYLIGLFRDRIIAINFGTTSLTDTYNASFLIPDFLFNLLIAGALASAFLPVFTEYVTKNKEEAYKIANTIITGGTMIIAILAVLAFIFMKEIVYFTFPNVTDLAQANIINMTRMILPSAIIFTISNSLGNILMSYKHFTSYSLSPVLYNLGIIIGVIFFSQSLGIYSAPLGVLIGGVLHAAIRLIDIHDIEYRFKFEIDFRHPGIKKIIKLMIPRTIGLITWQINLYIFAVVGMNLIDGGLAAFNFARNIQSFAVSLFGIAFATAVFPYLSTAISQDDKESYTSQIQTTMQRILFFTIPAAIGIMLLSTPIVSLILSGGIFKENSINITSLILFFFALSIPFEGLTHILQRSFYATQNTRTPMAISIITMLIISCCTIFLAPKMGIEWFSIGFTIGMAVEVILLIIFLRKLLVNFKIGRFLTSLSKIILASGIMGLGIIFTNDLSEFLNAKIATLMQILWGGAIFLFAAYILKSPEVSSVKTLLQQLIKRKTSSN